MRRGRHRTWDLGFLKELDCSQFFLPGCVSSPMTIACFAATTACLMKRPPQKAMMKQIVENLPPWTTMVTIWRHYVFVYFIFLMCCNILGGRSFAAPNYLSYLFIIITINMLPAYAEKLFTMQFGQFLAWAILPLIRL